MEKGTPTIVMKCSKTKMIMAKVAQSEGVAGYAVGVVKKMVEPLGYRSLALKSDNEPAILALKEAARRESDVEIVVKEAPVGRGWLRGSSSALQAE